MTVTNHRTSNLLTTVDVTTNRLKVDRTTDSHSDTDSLKTTDQPLSGHKARHCLLNNNTADKALFDEDAMDIDTHEPAKQYVDQPRY